MSNFTVAHTILDQLGGRIFLRTTGAKDVITYPNGLTFSLPARMAKNGINGVSITLTDDGRYNVEFFKVGMNKQINHVVSAHTVIGYEQLRELFERETGLYTSLYGLTQPE